MPHRDFFDEEMREKYKSGRKDCESLNKEFKAPLKWCLTLNQLDKVKKKLCECNLKSQNKMTEISSQHPDPVDSGECFVITLDAFWFEFHIK